MKNVLFNPVEKYSEKQILLVGVLLAVVASAVSTILNGRFDGVIDLHFVDKTTLISSAIDLTLGISILTISLFFVGKLINKKTRFIDILSTSLIAKIPFYFLLLFNINNKMLVVSSKMLDFVAQKEIHLDPATITFLIIAGIATFMCLIWSLILLYNGFKTATNLKETKHSILFILAVISAEIVSKIILTNNNY